MIERLLENWLDKANERSFQLPFCHALAAQGHTVLHMSRHCGMELGKDIITVDPSGVPCAYQLKGVDGGKMNLTEWRQELGNQISPLVMQKIAHPSITVNTPHHAFVVINGEFNEEVIHEIKTWNEARVDDGVPQRQLRTIVKGEMLEMFKSLQTDFWPTQLGDVKTLLELYLDNGTGPLPKEKLGALFLSVLPFETGDEKQPTKNQCSRAIASCAILCSLAISSFTNRNNHCAEFEAWTLYFCYVLGLAEKWRLPESYWKAEADLASEAMFGALVRCCDELKQRTHFVETDPFADKGVYDVRMTYLLGLMSVYGLWRKGRSQQSIDPDDDSQHDEFLRSFCSERMTKVLIWGEAVVPSLIASYLYRRRVDSTPVPDFQLMSYLEYIIRANKPGAERPLASPYYEAEAVLPYVFRLDETPPDDIFAGSSYAVESLLHLSVPLMWKQRVKAMWPDVTRIVLRSYRPEPRWQYYLWYSENGMNVAKLPPPTQTWDDLKQQANESSGADIPSLVKNFPIQYLCLLCVMPHRLLSSGVRWLASQL